MNIDIIENICEVIKILSATFVGASAAFCFDRHKLKIEEKNKNYTACLEAQTTFYQYLQSIYNIKTQFLDEFENDGERAAKIKHISFCDKFLSFDIHELSFILKTKNSDLLNFITNTYQNCISAIESVKERNEQYKKIASIAKPLENGEFVIPIPSVEMTFLKDYTDSMYKQFSNTIKKIKEADEELKKFIKSNFKGKHALCVEPIQNI